MRIHPIRLIVLLVGLSNGCSRENPGSAPGKSSTATPVALGIKPDLDILAQIHFVGTIQLLSDKVAAAKLNEIANLPETQGLENETLQKLATAPYRFFLGKGKLSAGAADEASLIRPLIDDLIHHESYLEVRSPEKPVPDLLLAVRVGNERIGFWQTNLSAILQAWTGITVSNIESEGYSGWELKKHHPPDMIRCIKAGEWVVFCWGHDNIAALPAFLQKIKKDGRPASVMREHWLEAWIDLPRLFQKESASSPFKLPAVQLAEELRDDNVRTKATFTFAEPLELKRLPDWQFPTNEIHNPLINFTAVRGVGVWLARLQLFQQLDVASIPDQFCTWGIHGLPFETYAATPVKNGSNFMAEVGPRLISVENSNLVEKGWGHLTWNDSHSGINWAGIPIITPNLKAISATNGDFALVGLIATAPSRSLKAPQDLFSQLAGRTNQLYYDWEITGERIGQWWNLLLLRHIFKAEAIGGASVPATKWIASISKLLGNAGTEITWTAPNELVLLRRSPLPLTALELAHLLDWEQASDFPLGHEYTSLPAPRRPGNGPQPGPSGPGGQPAKPSSAPPGAAPK